jgi:hypothetical protein
LLRYKMEILTIFHSFLLIYIRYIYMFSHHKATLSNGALTFLPSRNPNYIRSQDLYQDVVYDRADDSYRQHHEEYEYNKSKLGYPSIFDQVPANPSSLPHPVTRKDGEASHLPMNNPNYIGASGLAYENGGLIANEEIHKLFAVNAAIKRNNLGLAELLLGRKVTPEEIAQVNKDGYIKQPTPYGTMNKVFEVKDVEAIGNYTQQLDELGIGYKTKTIGDKVYIVSNPNSIESDTPTSTPTPNPESTEDAISVLSKYGIRQGRTSAVNTLKKQVIVDLFNAFGEKIDPTLNHIILKNLLKEYIQRPEIYDRLQKSKPGSRVTFAKSSKDEKLTNSEDSDDSSSSTSSEFVTPRRTKKTPKKGEPFEPVTDTPNPYQILGYEDESEEETTGSGLSNKKKKAGSKMKRIMLSGSTIKQLQNLKGVYMGEIDAGNDSKELKQDLAYILQTLYDKHYLSKMMFNKITKKYIM